MTNWKEEESEVIKCAMGCYTVSNLTMLTIFWLYWSGINFGLCFIVFSLVMFFKSETDLSCDKFLSVCLQEWKATANMHQTPHVAWRISPIPASHNWQSMKASKWFSAIDNLLAPAKTWAFSLQLLWQDGTKGRAGHSPCSCAYRTSRQRTSSTTKQEKPYGTLKRSDRLLIFQLPGIGSKSPLEKKNNIFFLCCIPRCRHHSAFTQSAANTVVTVKRRKTISLLNHLNFNI